MSGSENEIRKAVHDKAEDFLHLAKFKTEDLLSKRQVIRFSEPFLSDDYRLIEIDNELLENLREGEKCVFRGKTDDHPVFCTNDAAYNVKDAETSNSLLLLPACQIQEATVNFHDREPYFVDSSVVAMHSRYLELKPVPFRIGRLKDMLEERPYFGADNESQLCGSCYNMDELLDTIQGSEMQIRTAIKAMPVCEIEGKIRYLSFEFRSQLIGQVVDACEGGMDEGLNEDGLTGIALRKSFREKALPESVADWFLTAVCRKITTDSVDLYKLNEETVCRTYAEMLLRGANKLNLDDFLKAWDSCIPIQMRPNLVYLEGLAVIEEGLRYKTIEYFPVEQLPDDAQQRFDILFEKRNRWSYNDLCCYLKDLVSSENEIGSLLTKYCRSTTVNREKIYNLRD